MITIGVDLGQATDYTAIAVVDGHVLRHLERIDLGTPYAKQVERVTKIADALTTEQRGEPVRPRVLVDATGVGRAVVELFFGYPITPVTITASGAPHWGDYGMYVCKRDLVSTLVVAIENYRFMLADGLKTADLLLRELSNFKMKITTAGNLTFEAWREKDHDDLVLACCLAVWGQGKNLQRPQPEESQEDRMWREIEDEHRRDEGELVGLGYGFG